MVSIILISVAVICIPTVIGVYLLCRSAGREYADASGVEIAEEDIAGALERELRAFIDSENAKRCTGRLINYTPADHARMA